MQNLTKAQADELLAQLQQGVAVMTDYLADSPDAQAAQVVRDLQSRMATAGRPNVQTGTFDVRPAVPGYEPAVVKAAVPSNFDPKAAPTREEMDGVNAKLDKVLETLTGMAAAKAAVPVPSSEPSSEVAKSTLAGDLAALLGQNGGIETAANPVLDMLVSGDPMAYHKAAQLAGTKEQPDTQAVNKLIDQELNKSLKTLYGNPLVRTRWPSFTF